MNIDSRNNDHEIRTMSPVIMITLPHTYRNFPSTFQPTLQSILT